MVTGSEREAAQARERAATIIAQQAGISPEQANQWLDQLEAEVQQRTDQATTPISWVVDRLCDDMQPRYSSGRQPWKPARSACWCG
jgi:transposase-like protein